MAEAEEQNGKPTIDHYRQAFAEMSTARRLGFLAAFALVLGGFVALLLWINKPDYQTLYSGLPQADSAQVVEQLKELKIPYKLEADGTTIMVPQASLYEARLAMASSGLPKGGGVGFEVFNEVKIGTTDFVQKINYQRALQGELARTIASFGEVDTVRVHIVMGQESLFVEEEKKPSASVVLGMRGNRALSKRQVQGIVHLVASAVPDLAPERVTIVDNKGNLLYKKEANTADFPGALTANQLEHQRNVENALKAKVQSMLEQVVGPGAAVVRVSTELDFTRTTTTERLFNPDQVAVRSETRSSEANQDGGQRPSGSPDNRFDLAQRNATPSAGGTGQGAESTRENETTNFEISSTTRQTTSGIGGLKRLSVAVVVDGPYTETTSAEGEVTRSFKPRSAEELRQLTELVRRAVGYDEQRGDEVSVANVPFAMPRDLGTAAAMGWMDYVEKYSMTGLNVLLGILFFLFVVRPLMKYLTTRAQEVAEGGGAMVAAGGAPGGARVRQVVVGPGEELPPGQEMEMEQPDMLEAMNQPRKVTTRDMILALAQQDPEKTTAVLRAWIREL
jgi:flagellar M-ring protein FliF